ncbi:MAG TPA: carbohydrate-binding family 9-like protein, partial [Segetibacter sp.]
MRILLTISGFLFLNYVVAQKSPAPLLVRQCHDFDLTGKGNNAEWTKTGWNLLSRLDTGRQNYESKFKILYSSTGIYLLFDGKDNKITTKFDKDFENLYEGDVFEVFFHSNPGVPLYFEYEINQLNKEVVLIIPNFKGNFYGWIPWHYENDRRIKK